MANPIGLLLSQAYSTAGKIQELQNELEDIKSAIGYFRPFDARDYIKYPLNSYEKIWKYRGNYYSNKKELYTNLKQNNEIDITYQTFTKYDSEEQLWPYKINVVYLAKLSIPYYISSDGVFFTAKYLPVSTIGAGGQIRIMVNNEYKYLFCGYYAYKYFVDKEYNHPEKKIFYLIKGYNNSRIDYLTPHQDYETASEDI